MHGETGSISEDGISSTLPAHGMCCSYPVLRLMSQPRSEKKLPSVWEQLVVFMARVLFGQMGAAGRPATGIMPTWGNMWATELQRKNLPHILLKFVETAGHPTK